jgi:hypothetical protein
VDVKTQLARLKYAKALRNSKDEVYNFHYPVSGDLLPDFQKTEEAKNSTSIHPEIRKNALNHSPRARGLLYILNLWRGRCSIL